MVEPLRLAGLEPVYYPIRPDLGIDPERVHACMCDKVRALLVVHYFGFVQDLGALRRLADRYGIVLVEDCAHTLFGQTAGLPVGAVGDYAIASTMKFFALGDGGVLASARRDLADIRLARPPLDIEVKAAIKLLGGAIEFRRLGAAGRLVELANALKGRVRGWVKRLRPAADAGAAAPGAGARPPKYAPEYAMETPWLRRHGTRLGRCLLDHAHMGSLATRRRAFYAAYLRALAGRGDCRPLFPELPPGVVPQVFPLHVTQSLAVFVELKRQGIPINRFGEFLDTPVDAALCPVSLDYADHVLQFPCHQELLEAECVWIIDRLVTALNNAKPAP
jgi:dTDP-4-amino-4,6-dideoxygalactose transaminase